MIVTQTVDSVVKHIKRINNNVRLDYHYDRDNRKKMGTAIPLGLVVFLLLFGYVPSSYAQPNTTVSAPAAHINASPLVYHLSSSDPWRLMEPLHINTTYMICS